MRAARLVAVVVALGASAACDPATASGADGSSDNPSQIFIQLSSF